jgi:hypothetical protein
VAPPVPAELPPVPSGELDEEPQAATAKASNEP